MKWALDYPSRFLRERAEILRMETETSWINTAWRICEDGALAVDLDFTVHGRIYAGRMTYPDAFPDSPPYICPRDKSERWSSHQYGEGGPLCLQWRSDNWNPDVTGAEMVRSAYELLSTEQHPELPTTVPSAHYYTTGQGMRGTLRRFVATTNFLSIVNTLPLPSRTRLESTAVYSNASVVVFAARVEDVSNELQYVSDLPEGFNTSSSIFAPISEGLIFRSEAFAHNQSIGSIEELTREVAAAGFATDEILAQEAGKYKSRTIVLVGSELSSLQVYTISLGEILQLYELRIVLPSASELRVSEESRKLANIRVGIVGLGSIGSKIAVSLARSGIKKFLLIDDDYLIPGNITRHELSWIYVGTHKVHAMSDMLSLIASGIQVDVKTCRLAGQESAVTAATVLNDLSDCDMLIDATANPEVFLLLASIAKRHMIPLCWGEVFAGGFGGMIARARPKRDPNPLSIRDSYNMHLTTLPDAPFKTSPGYDGSEEHPLVAYDSDVGFFANALAQLAIDTALIREPSEFPYSVYMLGLRREWIFEAPFQAYPLDVQGQGWEPNDSSDGDGNVHDALKALREIIEGDKNANAGHPA